MAKKYLSYFVLLAAGFLLWYVLKNQRGNQPGYHPTNITLPANDDETITRHPASILYSKHARCRMECRHIDESEVKEILETGTINENKIQEDGRGKTYPMEGVTHDRQHVRIVFAPKKGNMVEVVTCIDLDTEWPCNCK
jgi:Domain of unknown function (DUF4258)